MTYPFPLDNDGWSIFPTDGNLIYVNADTGDDTTGDGSIDTPYASYTRANLDITRRGPQTTVLVESLPSETMIGGPVALTSDPYVVASASNNAALIQNAGARITDRFYGVRNFSLIGITIYTPEKDPQSQGFDFSTAPTNFTEGGISSLSEALHNLLIEGCFLKCGSAGLQNNKNLLDSNVIIRRCIIYYSWSHTGGHRQGFFANGLRNILLEECIFYHNGWLQQAISSDTVGKATIFNHNLYWANCENVTIRNTVSLLPSSIHFKFTSNPPGPTNEIYAKNITIHDCFLYDGEVSMSLGGNDDYGDGPRWKDMNVANCVITQVGLSRPTNRSLSFGIDCNDWEGGKVQGNISSRFIYSNGYHISLGGHSSDVIISDNTLYQSITDPGLTGCIKLSGNNLTNITVEKNIIQSLPSDGYLINVSDANALSNISFSNNIYYSNNPTPFRVGSNEYTYEQWVSLTGETGSQYTEITFNDPDKTFEDYAALQGHTLEQAFDSIRDLDYKANSISNYPYNAENLLNYFRQNFQEDSWALESQVYRRNLRELLAVSDGTQSLGDPSLPFNNTRDPGSRIIFVDSVFGDNSTAEIYWWDGSYIIDSNGSRTNESGQEYGKNPLRPNLAALKPFSVLNNDSRLFTQQGMPSPQVVPASGNRLWRKAGLSGGYQDWFLFRRGQQHSGYASLFGGVSQEKPTVFAAYGPYEDGRALLSGIGGHNWGQPFSQLHVVLLSFESPGLSYLWSHKNTVDINGDPVSAYVEDVRLTNMSYPPRITTITRSVIEGSFSTGGHNQGYFTGDFYNKVTFDEVILYRNGYIGDPYTNADPRRTIYSRNIYQGGGAQLGHRYLNIISADGASGGPQMRLGAQIENSFILEGYWHTGTHSNSVVNPWIEDNGQTGSSAIVRNNVQMVYDYPTPADPDTDGLSDGRANPSWGFRLQGSTFGAEVSGNIISSAMLIDDLSAARASFGIYHEVNQYDYGNGAIAPINNSITNNIIYKAADGFSFSGNSNLVQNVTFENNVVVAEDAYGGTIVNGVTVSNNTFYTNNDGGLSGTNTIESYDFSLAETQQGWSDPDRTIKRYVTEVLGLTLLEWADSEIPQEQITPRENAGELYDPMGLKTFMAVASNMRAGGTDNIPTSGKPNPNGDYPWDERFTGQSVVNWIRAGFGLSSVDNSTIINVPDNETSYLPIDDNTLQLVTSLSQGGITWNFESPVLARQSIDGAWVVEGPVTLTSVTPDVTGTGESLRNGLMVNPFMRGQGENSNQAWDGRDISTFDESLESSNFPLLLQPNTVCVKCVSAVIQDQDQPDRAGYPAETSAIYVIDDITTLPFGDFFSPSPLGWEGRVGFDFYDSRVIFAVPNLPEYDVSSHVNKPDYATLEAKLNRFQATAGYSRALSGGGYQAWLLHETGRDYIEGVQGAMNYGQWVMINLELAALGLIGNEWTAEQKKTLLVAMASTGIHLMQQGIGANNAGPDYYNSISNDGLGGHAQWQQFLFDCAILASDQSPTENLHTLSQNNMLMQAFQLTPELKARLAPHTNTSDPFDYREREVLAVDTTSTPNTITVNLELGGENFRISTSSNKRVVSTDGLATSLMADPLNTGTLTVAETVIPVENASGFSGKTVYFEEVNEYQVGEYLWLDKHWRVRFSNFDVELRAAYSATNNRWAGWVLFTLATGVWDEQRTPAIRWTENRFNGVRSQTAPFQTSWSNEFWVDHASTIFSATIDAT